ncbi:hypothetical protein Hte_012180 [Hypoxylon texense]
MATPNTDIPSTGIVVDFKDRSHPNYHITRRNFAESSLLGKLSTEIRNEIFKLAVQQDDPVFPYQVEKGSNKFARRHWHYITRDDSKPLTAVALAQTCRAIYADLEYFCPFYKVNTFAFISKKGIHTFLSAITTRRRQAIHYIDLVSRGLGRGFSSLENFQPRRFYNPDGDDRQYREDDILALLSQSGVKGHQLSLTIDYFRDTNLAASGGHVADLRQYLELANAPVDKSIWSLPCFRLNVVCNGQTFKMGYLDQTNLQQSGLPPEMISVM